MAIFIYLTDLFPKAGLAPLIGDPLRGVYLRWMVYYAACFEPALVDRSMNREPAPAARSPYGDFDTMLKTIADQIGRGPYLLGRDFSAADVLWGLAFRWSTMFNLVPETEVIADYVKRVTQRPSVVNVAAMDADLIAEHERTVERMPA